MKAFPIMLLINILIIFYFSNLGRKDHIKIDKNIRFLEGSSESESSESESSESEPSGSESSGSESSGSESSGSESSGSESSGDESSGSELSSGESNIIDETTNSNELDFLLLGEDNYKDNGRDESYFFAKYFIKNEKDFKKIISLVILVNENLRLLDEETIECINIENKTQIYIYNCSYKHNGNIKTIRVQAPKDSTDYAKYLCEHLINQTGNSVPEEIFVITDCFIVDQSKNVIVNGNTYVDIPNNKESILYLLEKGTMEEIPLKFIKKEGSAANYDMSLTLKKSLETDLNGKSGIVNINGRNMNYILSFKNDSNSSSLDYDYNPSVNKINFKKSSSSLSGGAIVAIILPCIAVLLAIVGLVIYLSKSSSGAAAASTIPMENIGNNTIGISSSTHDLNK